MTPLEKETLGRLDAVFLFCNRWAAGETVNYYGREMEANEVVAEIYAMLAPLHPKLKAIDPQRNIEAISKAYAGENS